eukprot:scpid6605/ scgid5662/ Helicase sen1
MPSCLWCQRTEWMVDKLPSIANGTAPAHILQQSEEELGRCCDCVAEYHRECSNWLRSAGMPAYSKRIYKRDLLRLTQRFQMFLVKSEPDDIAAPVDLEKEVKAALYEVLLAPALLWDKKLAELFVKCLLKYRQQGGYLDWSEKLPGMYLLLVYPDLNVSVWAWDVVREAGEINEDDYLDVEEVIRWIMAAVEGGFCMSSATSDMPMAPTIDYYTIHESNASATPLCAHLRCSSAHQLNFFWLGIERLLKIISPEALRRGLLANNRKFVDTLLTVLKRGYQAQDLELRDCFWIVLRCLVFLLHTLDSAFWQYCSEEPDDMLQMIALHTVYQREMQRLGRQIQDQTNPVAGSESYRQCTFGWFVPFILSMLEFGNLAAHAFTSTIRYLCKIWGVIVKEQSDRGDFKAPLLIEDVLRGNRLAVECCLAVLRLLKAVLDHNVTFLAQRTSKTFWLPLMLGVMQSSLGLSSNASLWPGARLIVREVNTVMRQLLMTPVCQHLEPERLELLKTIFPESHPASSLSADLFSGWQIQVKRYVMDMLTYVTGKQQLAGDSSTECACPKPLVPTASVTVEKKTVKADPELATRVEVIEILDSDDDDVVVKTEVNVSTPPGSGYASGNSSPAGVALLPITNPDVVPTTDVDVKQEASVSALDTPQGSEPANKGPSQDDVLFSSLSDESYTDLAAEMSDDSQSDEFPCSQMPRFRYVDGALQPPVQPVPDTNNEAKETATLVPEPSAVQHENDTAKYGRTRQPKREPHPAGISGGDEGDTISSSCPASLSARTSPVSFVIPYHHLTVEEARHQLGLPLKPSALPCKSELTDRNTQHGQPGEGRPVHAASAANSPEQGSSSSNDLFEEDTGEVEVPSPPCVKVSSPPSPVRDGSHHVGNLSGIGSGSVFRPGLPPADSKPGGRIKVQPDLSAYGNFTLDDSALSDSAFVDTTQIENRSDDGFKSDHGSDDELAGWAFEQPDCSMEADMMADFEASQQVTGANNNTQVDLPFAPLSPIDESSQLVWFTSRDNVALPSAAKEPHAMATAAAGAPANPTAALPPPHPAVAAPPPVRTAAYPPLAEDCLKPKRPPCIFSLLEAVLAWRSMWFLYPSVDQRTGRPLDTGNAYKEDKRILPLPIAFKSVDEYVGFFEPLVRSEVWYQVSAAVCALHNSKPNVFLGCVTSADKSCPNAKRSRLVAMQGCLSPCDGNRRGPLSERDLVLVYLHTETSHPIKDLHRGMCGRSSINKPRVPKPLFFPTGQANNLAPVEPIFAIVQSVEKRKQQSGNVQEGVAHGGNIDENGQLVVMTVNLLVDGSKLRHLGPGKKAFLVPVDNLTGWQRCAVGLHRLHTSLLARDVLSPRGQEYFSSRGCLVTHDQIARVSLPFNACQKEIIATTCSAVREPYCHPRTSLLQGPPGTGKTHMIVGLIATLLKLCTSKSAEKKTRILLCAPSHAAVDEIACRLVSEGLIFDPTRASGGGGHAHLLRTGALERMNPVLHPYSLEQRVREKHDEQFTHSSANGNNVEEQIQEVTALLEKVEKKCSVLRFDMNSKKKNPKEVAHIKPDMDAAEKERITLERKLRALRLSKRQAFPRKRKSFRQMEEIVFKECLKQADIVATTLSGSGSDALSGAVLQLNRRMFFTCVIIDEAAQCSELDALIPLQYGSSKLVLVGDPCQLPATVKSQTAECNLYGRSLFERFFKYFEQERHRQPSPVRMLREQYRMHPDICGFSSRQFYHDKLQTSSVVLERPAYPVAPFTALNLLNSREDLRGDGRIFNPIEIRLVVAVCKFLVTSPSHPIPARSIGIITPYREQVEKLKAQLKDREYEGIEVLSVDGFQGREKDVIILSCVRAQGASQSIGFVRNPQRLNVAMTRARRSLIAIGHYETLKVSKDWAALLDFSKSTGNFQQIVSAVDSAPRLSSILTRHLHSVSSDQVPVTSVALEPVARAIVQGTRADPRRPPIGVRPGPAVVPAVHGMSLPAQGNVTFGSGAASPVSATTSPCTNTAPPLFGGILVNTRDTSGHHNSGTQRARIAKRKKSVTFNANQDEVHLLPTQHEAPVYPHHTAASSSTPAQAPAQASCAASAVASGRGARNRHSADSNPCEIFSLGEPPPKRRPNSLGVPLTGGGSTRPAAAGSNYSSPVTSTSTSWNYVQQQQQQ